MFVIELDIKEICSGQVASYLTFGLFSCSCHALGKKSTASSVLGCHRSVACRVHKEEQRMQNLVLVKLKCVTSSLLCP